MGALALRGAQRLLSSLGFGGEARLEVNAAIGVGEGAPFVNGCWPTNERGTKSHSPPWGSTLRQVKYLRA